ncbi:hypothetical protein SJAG_04776 [Schizosaccharomyces japonicus yFS275]|uniref:Uncharacterized protein n=1 Tax=Schizosaccharomyces japonicus (strain yFS275 / FY16936) TaxID=402676 RepID=B6K7Q8_SCHJY|nr:hypothetical protein SJAG_04776 [Schizosaccharomyces japonicus yFS275]EEB09562.1 hypothetical protein SJAG_04776 [Schizosaccharomyces japonicus yFS275]
MAAIAALAQAASAAATASVGLVLVGDTAANGEKSPCGPNSIADGLVVDKSRRNTDRHIQRAQTSRVAGNKDHTAKHSSSGDFRRSWSFAPRRSASVDHVITSNLFGTHAPTTHPTSTTAATGRGSASPSPHVSTEFRQPCGEPRRDPLKEPRGAEDPTPHTHSIGDSRCTPTPTRARTPMTRGSVRHGRSVSLWQRVFSRAGGGASANARDLQQAQQQHQRRTSSASSIASSAEFSQALPLLWPPGVFPLLKAAAATSVTRVSVRGATACVNENPCGPVSGRVENAKRVTSSLRERDNVKPNVQQQQQQQPDSEPNPLSAISARLAESVDSTDLAWDADFEALSPSLTIPPSLTAADAQVRRQLELVKQLSVHVQSIASRVCSHARELEPKKLLWEEAHTLLLLTSTTTTGRTTPANPANRVIVSGKSPSGPASPSTHLTEHGSAVHRTSPSAHSPHTASSGTPDGQDHASGDTPSCTVDPSSPLLTDRVRELLARLSSSDEARRANYTAISAQIPFEQAAGLPSQLPFDAHMLPELVRYVADLDQRIIKSCSAT